METKAKFLNRTANLIKLQNDKKKKKDVNGNIERKKEPLWNHEFIASLQIIARLATYVKYNIF